MNEPTYLTNGRFLQDLGGMETNEAAYAADDGDEHYGVAMLATGGAQSAVVRGPGRASHKVHLSVKAVGSPLSSSQRSL